MNPVSIIGKTLDQPLLVSKFSRAVPGILTMGATAYALYDVYKTPKEDRKKSLIKNLCVLGFTVGSALLATRGLKPIKLFGKQIFKGFNGLSENHGIKDILTSQTKLIDDYLTANPVSSKVSQVLNKAKNKVLNFSEVKLLLGELGKGEAGKNLLKQLIPGPENVTSSKIFSEIGRLSLIGLIPVLGGITGGITGDALTENNWKQRIPDKIKEGSYQYLANIFMCNVGAGGALAIMEKMNIQSKCARATGMITGIILTGVLGGSVIANYLCNKLIDPLFGKTKSSMGAGGLKNIYAERKPEALDIGLHTDDIATIAVMSGLKWIEPVLPMLYSISGYRAGIGYRNGHTHHQKEISSTPGQRIEAPLKRTNSFNGSLHVSSDVYQVFEQKIQTNLR